VSDNRVDPRRSVDDAVTVLRVDGEDGVMAIVVGFACHGTCVGGQTLRWNADFPHALRVAVERAHPGVECLFFQACAGDLAPLDSWSGSAPRHPPAARPPAGVGGPPAQEAGRGSPTIGTPRAPAPGVTSRILPLRRRHLPWSDGDLDRADKRLAAESEP